MRRVGVPLAVAFVVLAVVLGVILVADPPGSAPGGSVVGSPGSDGGSAPGSSGVAEPPSSAPGGPAPDPDQPMSRFTAVTPGPDGKSLDVQFWGGVDDCYRYTVGTSEDDQTVTLSLTEKATFSGACIELAQQYDRTVPLDGDLGARQVIDATTGEILLAPSP